MKWTRRKSQSFEDRRGKKSEGKKTLLGGGVIGIIALALQLFGGETGKTIGNVLNQVNQNNAQTQTTTSGTRELSEKEKTLGEFSQACFVYNDETWQKIFKESNSSYKKPGMIIFDDQVSTACGNASAASGPFYCPGDQKLYMDLRFFEELHTRFGAKRGDFAIAYVIAHEMGHHIQTVIGTNKKIRQLQQGKSKAEANKLSVAQELQADFYAGIWANRNKNLLEAGDIEEALSAAQAVGDDTIQSRTSGNVQPETFTHGTSKERQYWFMKGYETGNISLGEINKIYQSISY